MDLGRVGDRHRGDPDPADRGVGRRVAHDALHDDGRGGDALRGEFFSLIGDPRREFERIEAQLSGHYLLGVEVGPTDPVEDRRRIEVSAARRGAEVRVRHGNAHARVLRALRPADAETLSVDERLMAMLRSPLAEPWLPLRVSTYAYPDGSGRARVAVTARVGGGGVDGSDVTVAYALLDTWGTVVSSGRRQMAGTSANRRDDGAYEYTLPITAAPGRYALRVAAVDAGGRLGSVEHALRAGVTLSDAPLALGTLAVTDAEAPGGGRPGAEVVVSSGHVAVLLDVLAESAWVFNRVRVAIEVARDESAPALVQQEAPLRGGDDAPRRTASARLAVGELAPGDYVVRARALRRGLSCSVMAENRRRPRARVAPARRRPDAPHRRHVVRARARAGTRRRHGSIGRSASRSDGPGARLIAPRARDILNSCPWRSICRSRQ